MTTHGKHLSVSLAVVLTLAAPALLIFVAGCGGGTATTASETTTATTATTTGTSDKYEGTWAQKDIPGASPRTPIIIKKVGDQYAFTDPSGETYGQIIHTDPTESGQYTVYAMILDKGATASKDGDMLKLSIANQTIEITVSGDTLTMVVLQGVFTFSRVATQGGAAEATTTTAEATTITAEATTTSEEATTTTEVLSQKWGATAEVNGLRIHRECTGHG